MKKQNFYLLLSIIGFILPYYYFLNFINLNGLDFYLFFRQIFSNDIGKMFGIDLIISAIVLFLMIFNEKNLFKNKKVLLIPIIGCLTIGVSFALPFYLYLKEKSKII